MPHMSYDDIFAAMMSFTITITTEGTPSPSLSVCLSALPTRCDDVFYNYHNNRGHPQPFTVCLSVCPAHTNQYMVSSTDKLLGPTHIPIRSTNPSTSPLQTVHLLFETASNYQS